MTTDTFAPLPPAAPVAVEPIQGHDSDAVPPMQSARDPLPEGIQHRRLGVPSKVWRYLDASGARLFAVARFDQPNDEKQVLPFTCGPDSWVFKAPEPPRPLYGLGVHAARPEAPVLIVEGEKAADAAAAMFPDWVPMTWQGGSNAVYKSDHSPLRGRREVTKLMAVLAMLRRPEGLTVAQVGETTGWGKDTVRGFFAGLKKKGITVEVVERIRQVGPNRAESRGSYTVYRVTGA